MNEITIIMLMIYQNTELSSEILTHAEFSIFESFRVHIYDPFSKTRKSFELKTVQEQRANIPYKISKDEQKRISSNKVTSILPLSFFLAVHGSNQNWLW